MNGLFAGAAAFNQPLNNWPTSSVTDMSNMFRGAAAFDNDITDWNCVHVGGEINVFLGATAWLAKYTLTQDAVHAGIASPSGHPARWRRREPAPGGRRRATAETIGDIVFEEDETGEVLISVELLGNEMPIIGLVNLSIPFSSGELPVNGTTPCSPGNRSYNVLLRCSYEILYDLPDNCTAPRPAATDDVFTFNRQGIAFVVVAVVMAAVFAVFIYVGRSKKIDTLKTVA